MGVTPARFVDDPAVVVDEARSKDDVQRIRREVAGRLWAARHGIPTAEIIAKDPDDRWLVSRRVVDEPGEPMEYVLAAFEVARRIQDLPCPDFARADSPWRAPRRTAVWRVARMVASGVEPRAFVAVRRAFDRLPADATVHNDFHRKNVLNTCAQGHATVIDWDLTSVGPRHQDLVMLIIDVRDDDVAHAAWRMLVESVPPAGRASLAAQLRWLSLRTYASELVASRGDHDQTRRIDRRHRWTVAQDWARELDTYPREVL